MTPVLQLFATLFGGAMALLLARYLRDLSADWTSADIRSIPTGAAAGVIAGFLQGPWSGLIIGGLMTVAALYLSRSGLEPDFLSVAVTGALLSLSAAAVILLFPSALAPAMACGFLVSGPAAALLVSSGTRLLPSKASRSVLALIGSSLLAWGVMLGVKGGLFDAETTAVVIVGIPPILLLGALFLQWPTLVRELREEAGLELFPPEEVAGVAHPLRRLGLGGWQDRDTRRKFIQKATELGLKKNRQRKMGDSEARLYQLEILKLRMEIREIVGVQHALLRDAREAAADSSTNDAPTSDTMATERATPHR